MTRRLETSTLKLLKAEKSFMQTGSIISAIVDDVVTDDDEESTTTLVPKPAALCITDQSDSSNPSTSQAPVDNSISEKDCRPFTASSDTVPLIRSRMMKVLVGLV